MLAVCMSRCNSRLLVVILISIFLKFHSQAFSWWSCNLFSLTQVMAYRCLPTAEEPMETAYWFSSFADFCGSSTIISRDQRGKPRNIFRFLQTAEETVVTLAAFPHSLVFAAVRRVMVAIRGESSG